MVATPLARTWTPGLDLVTAAYLNAMRDQINFAINPPHVKLNQVNSQTLTGWTEVTLSGLEVDSLGNQVSGNRFVCQVAGRYEFTGSCGWASLGTSTAQYLGFKSYTMGTTAVWFPGRVTFSGLDANLTAEIPMNVGDTMALMAYNNQAAPGLTTRPFSGTGYSDTQGTWMSARWSGSY